MYSCIDYLITGFGLSIAEAGVGVVIDIYGTLCSRVAQSYCNCYQRLGDKNVCRYIILFWYIFSQLIFIWKIDGISKNKKKKTIFIKWKWLKSFIVLQAKSDFYLGNSKKGNTIKGKYINSVSLVSLQLQIVSHILYIMFILFRIILFETDINIYKVLQAVIFTLSIVYTIILMIYQGVLSEKIKRKKHY